MPGKNSRPVATTAGADALRPDCESGGSGGDAMTAGGDPFRAAVESVGSADVASKASFAAPGSGAASGMARSGNPGSVGMQSVDAGSRADSGAERTVCDPGGKAAQSAAVRHAMPFRHLLVLRTSAMGDVAMLPHALRALKAAYPGLRVTVATQAMFRPFFAGLDVEFLDVDPKGAHHSLAGMWRLAAEARRRGVDAVADVHDVLRSQAFRLAMRLHGIAVANIDKGRADKRRFIRCGGRGMEPLRHTVLRYCDVFRRLGFVLEDPVPAAATPHPDPFGPKQGVRVGFAPFSAHRGKTYPEAQSRELVRFLAARYERVFIHSGGGAEAAFAAEMERSYPNVTALWGKVRFAGEIDLIANLDCVVTMDSLVMHLAALVATPTVSVWGATHPGLGFSGYGSAADGMLQADMECRPCSVFGSKPCRFGDYRCLTAVTPERIAERVAAIVSRSQTAGKP